MKRASALVSAAVLTATAVAAPGPAAAGQHWDSDVSGGLSSGAPVGGYYSRGYRCSRGPVYNMYDGAYFGEIPAVYLGYAYRPYYRYTAYRVFPTTYSCFGYRTYYDAW